MIYLLDTDTFIWMMRGLQITSPRNENERRRRLVGNRILAKAQRHKLGGADVGVSAITMAELEFGARHSQDYEREIELTYRMLTPFTLFEFDATDCAFHYGDIRNVLENSGNTIGAMDSLIAAHGLALGARVVTNNVKEFGRVPGLKVENWVS